MKAFVLSREKYKLLKKMDHERLNEFCEGICKKAYTAGMTDGVVGIVYAIEEGKIKGIGKVTAKKIEKYLSKEDV